MAEKLLRTEKSVDTVVGTWSNMSQAELDVYLNYSNADSKAVGIVRVPTSSNKRISGRVRHSPGKIHIADRTIAVDSIKLTNKYRKPCAPHLDKIQIIDDAFFDLRVRTRVALGLTASPILNSILCEPSCGCGLYTEITPDDLIDPHLTQLLLDVEMEIKRLAIRLFNNTITANDITGLPRLRRLHTKLETFNGKGFLKMLTLITHVILSCKNLDCYVERIVIMFLIRLENCYRDIINKNQNKDHEHVVDDPLSGFDLPASHKGFIILAPPGTGKSQFLKGLPFGIIDTDWIQTQSMDTNQKLMHILVDAGFSIITNRWEWAEWNLPVYFMQPHDKLRAQRKREEVTRSFETSDKAHIRARGVSFRQNRIKDPDPYVHFKGADETVTTIALNEDQSLIHGFSMLIDYFLTS